MQLRGNRHRCQYGNLVTAKRSLIGSRLLHASIDQISDPRYLSRIYRSGNRILIAKDRYYDPVFAICPGHTL